MTLCLGWKHQEDVLIVADAAVTTTSRPNDEGETSFGERSAEITGRYVHEAALKAIPIGGAVAAFAGCERVGRALLESIHSCHQSGHAPFEALRHGLLSCAPFPDDPSQAISVIYGFREGGATRLLAWESRSPHENPRDCDRCVVGSVPPFERAAITKIVEQRLPFDSKRTLACLLAVCQGISSSRYLMESHIGGVFSGIGVGIGGVLHQPDMLYLLVDARMHTLGAVSVVARYGVLIADSTFGSGPKVFGDTLSFDGEIGTIHQAYREARTVFETARYEFVCFINQSRQNIVVVEMRRERKHRLFAIAPAHEESRIGVRVQFGREMHALLTEPHRFKSGRVAEVSVKSRAYVAPEAPWPIADVAAG